MSKNKKKGSQISTGSLRSSKRWIWMAALVAILIAGGIVALLATKEYPPRSEPPATTSPATGGSTNPSAPQPVGETKPPSELLTMEVAKAVVVTAELDFGSKVPSIAEALREIERRHQPADGQGRTFAVLDAYGEPTADGKLHISMHVSSEKPGMGSLVFRRTGEILWQSKITPASSPTAAKELNIIIDNGRGTGQWIDGSGNPPSILDAKVRDLKIPVRDFWPDGAEREVTFIYSACGCPVKVVVRRAGEKTIRTKELPVIFPDDPAAVATIKQLMRW